MFLTYVYVSSRERGEINKGCMEHGACRQLIGAIRIKVKQRGNMLNLHVQLRNELAIVFLGHEPHMSIVSKIKLIDI